MKNILPFLVESITVENTGLGSEDVEEILWIDSTRLEITNPVECIVEDGVGGTTKTEMDEFDWDFNERDFVADPYVLIKLLNK